MIRMIQSSSAGHAKAYFDEALVKSDYYLNDQELQGNFKGIIAQRLGVDGTASRETFHALCENLNPNTGDSLTPRTKDERTVGYDINFHCPKSVSILHVLSKDDHILKAFEQSVTQTMQDMENDAQTRVRKKGQYHDRKTGSLIWAEFTHQTARPVEDKAPDPHLHSHCFVFNVTWDEMEKQLKAGKFRDIKRDMPYYQARFHKRLSDNLITLGYQIRKTDKSFEVVGVPQKALDLFSKRTDEIGRVAKEMGITGAKELSELGARTRAKKQKGMNMGELKELWRKQLQELETDSKEGNTVIRHTQKKHESKMRPELCIDHALNHSFERASVMSDRRILESAYKYSLGNSSVSLDEITARFDKDNRIIQVKDGSRMMCTTKEVLAEEKNMVSLARQGQGKLKPLYNKAPNLISKDQQAAAISHVLTTAHRVSIIRGAAGAGKTTLMQEAVFLIEKADKKVTIIAPSSRASRGVLQSEGFENADTVAKFLLDKQAQDATKDQVIWVDEAGLLGTKDMTSLLNIATKQNARLILGGDTRQHASVVRGDALRILNKVAGIRTAEVSKIYRQKNETYKSACEDLFKGQVKEAFDKLDGLGAVQEIDPLKPNEKLVDDYMKALKRGHSALIISPTHKQGEAITDDIRIRLRKGGRIGKKEITIDRYSNLNLTEAEKSDWKNFQKGQFIQFNQNNRGIKRGSLWEVEAVKDKNVLLKNREGKSAMLPVERSADYDVFQKLQLALAKGDKVQITRNGFDKKRKRLDSGQTFDVLSVSKNGDIILRNATSKAKYELSKDYGHLAHAHCITSYASQGSTVDEVFISQPASTFPATDAKQFYVSVSRGKHAVKIYTDDKMLLLHHASEIGDRQSAIELIQNGQKHQDHLNRNLNIRPGLNEQPKQKIVPDISPITHLNRDYEI